MTKELSAEFIGTFTLVTAVCGAALFSAPSAGLVAVAFAVGLSVLAMAYAVGHDLRRPFQSGGDLRAVWRRAASTAAGPYPYIIAQVAGGVAGRPRCSTSSCQGAPAAASGMTFVAVSNTYGGCRTFTR